MPYLKKSYSELLRDPRWQRKRLEIFARANWTCENCEAVSKPLNVHHRIYRRGKKPWEYDEAELVCLCEDCHEQLTDLLDHINESLAQLIRVRGIGQVLCLLKTELERNEDDEIPADLSANELLEWLESRGCTLRRNDQNIRTRGPKRFVRDRAVLFEILKQKNSLLCLIDQRTHTEPVSDAEQTNPESLSLSELVDKKWAERKAEEQKQRDTESIKC